MLSWSSDSPPQHPPLHLLLLHPLPLGHEEAPTVALWTAAAASESKSVPPTDFPSTECWQDPCASEGASPFSHTHFLFLWKLLFGRYYCACLTMLFILFWGFWQLGRLEKCANYMNCWSVVNIFMNASLSYCFFIKLLKSKTLLFFFFSPLSFKWHEKQAA